jgi:hypothetical protein
MKSKWSHLKNRAVKLRKEGLSIRAIEEKLEIPRSTLSVWFKSVELTETQKVKLHRDWQNALTKARKEAVKWHNEEKRLRLQEAEQWAEEVFSRIDLNNELFLHLAFAMLYLGEGFKKTVETAMGNSDSLILRFFVSMLIFYGVNLKKIKCELHLRADQNVQAIKRYWSKELKIPLSNFTSVSVDKRTEGKPTYPHYKGVCIVKGSNVAIQRKIMYLSKKFCDRATEKIRAYSSAG